MSNVNIKRAVENIRANTTVYTPVVEVIVNAIQAIDATGRKDGRIYVRAKRNSQTELDGAQPDIISFEVEDNGIGFSQTHRDAFDTLFTDMKIREGGKGFGRFTCLKYFDDVRVVSSFADNNAQYSRSFRMGQDHDIIVDEKVSKVGKMDSSTTVTLARLRKVPSFDKGLETVARHLVERLLPFFIADDYICPDILLSEADRTVPIRLNDFVSNSVSSQIKEIRVERNRFSLEGTNSTEEFVVRVFKFYAPRNQRSRISLVAHKREVSGATLQKYIPEFEDEFYDKPAGANGEGGSNYIIKAYVFSAYLDRHVSLERGGFEFHQDSDLLFGISQSSIEREAASIAKRAVGDEIVNRQEKKRVRVQSYVDEEAPWHKEILAQVDLSILGMNPTNRDIELILQSEKLKHEIEIKRDVERILQESNFEDIKQSVIEIVHKITGTSKNDLIHYIALRRKILDIFQRSLETNESGAYESEGVVHDIIFPRRGDSDKTPFEKHNLWIVDERLNFTSYVSSDVPLNGPKSERPDLIAYNRRVLFRGENESSNPITIFEFKRPQRDDFVNASSTEDPVKQIVRYVNDIRENKYKTPAGRKIQVARNTPFYGYVVCDLTEKVEKWLELEQDFKRMPDGLGWFKWMGNINLYIEVNSWDKVLKDARMRNHVFFEKLGLV